MRSRRYAVAPADAHGRPSVVMRSALGDELVASPLSAFDRRLVSRVTRLVDRDLADDGLAEVVAEAR